MPGIFIAIIGLLVISIIFVNLKNPFQKKTREQYLQELAHFLEGKVEPIEDKENSFRISFNFENYKFVFEDIELLGFGAKDTKGQLIAETSRHLNFGFVETREKTSIKSGIMLASEIVDEPARKIVKVRLPESLSKFTANTNDPTTANRLMQDERVVQVFESYRNKDARGYHTISLRIVDGKVILEYQRSGITKPSLLGLIGDTASIESDIRKLLIIKLCL